MYDVAGQKVACLRHKLSGGTNLQFDCAAVAMAPEANIYCIVLSDNGLLMAGLAAPRAHEASL